ncbi:MAG: glutamate 5-kinase [Firmicutes bacterium]|nr:glutamate 5-kinase [Bacillota bacterium]
MRSLSSGRIVIKVGTTTLTYPNGKLHYAAIEKLVRDIADLQNSGREVILVSSGAVGAGMGRLGRASRPKTIPEKQAVAAVGQGLLMQIYERLFSQYGQVVAQVLLTREDICDRQRYLNARNALFTILSLGAIPIINENDTVAVDELKFGDNDTLSALVASLVDADLLIILSDIDGVYDVDPRVNPGATLLPDLSFPELIQRVNPGGAGTGMGTGGMYTKLEAARIATTAGTGVIIANGAEPNILSRLCAGEELGTYIAPKTSRLRSRERWIAFNLPRAGRIIVDDGAYQAIKYRGKSLLPSGIRGIEGEFSAGEAVEVITPSGQPFARGIVNYSSGEIEKIAGRQSSEIEDILGYKYYTEVIHRDNLVLIDEDFFRLEGVGNGS